MNGICEITKKVVFKDQTGSILKTYEIGDRIPFTNKMVWHNGDGYFICGMGGIYFDEAKEIPC